MLVSDNLIEVSNLRKSYGQGDNRVDVLKGIDCKIKRGSICTLLGPSGSGKSTFLNILGGIESFEEGSLIVDGLELKNLSKKDLLQYRRDKLGFVFQFYNLVSNLTLKENIEVGAYLSKDPLDLDDLIEKLGLVDHQSKFPNQLSGGQQQRTAIARALSKGPTILLCDEPTGALDYSTAKDVLKMIQKINKEYKSTIIIATHNTAIAGMSHEVLSLHDGTNSSSIFDSSTISTFSTVFVPTRIFCSLYPIQEKTRVDFADTLIEYFPFTSVTVPLVVPSSIILAPGIGPSASVTTPETLTF